ncbi:MAG TPA: thioesterase family protein [Longimicrobiales bacterium]|nr:thioesterase family protein [Longimicrobiales bacterium]
MQPAELAGFPVVITIPVAWGEMDAFGHVNNIVYFRWFESARIAYLDAIAFRGGDAGVGPILASTQCRFRRPLEYPDVVHVGARTTDVAEDRFTMEYRIVSDAAGGVAAEGSGVIVAYDYASAGKAALPAAVRARIGELEQVGSDREAE